MAIVLGSPADDFIHQSGDGNVPPPGATEIIGVTGEADGITPGLGADTVFAGNGDDVIFVRLLEDIDGLPEYLDGGAGVDSLELEFGGIVDLTQSTLVDFESLGVGVGMETGGLRALVRPDQIDGLTFVGGGVGFDAIELASPGMIEIGGVGGRVFGLDFLLGSAGSDTIDISALGGELTVDGAAGDDALSFTYTGRVFTPQHITLVGGDGDDALVGDRAKFLLDGGRGKDELTGGRFGDTLEGGAGRDRLLGGGGRDELIGGDGGDRFLFRGLDQSTPFEPDRIVDFDAAAGDRIVLKNIDADTTTEGNQAFTLGGAAFTCVAGELIQFSPGGGGRTVLQGDVNGDALADFTVELAGGPVLTADALVL